MAKRPTNKARTMARNYPVPQSRDDADDFIRQLGEVRRELARIEADMNDRLAEIKEKHETRAAPFKGKAEELLCGIETWCAANREALTRGGKVKFATFKNGEVRWRDLPPKVSVRGTDVVLDALKGLGLQRFVRTKEEINKDAIREDAEAVKSIKGLTVGSAGETFVVEPFEGELEAKKAS